MNKESTAEVEVYGGSIGEFFENLWGHMTLNYTNCIREEKRNCTWLLKRRRWKR